MLIKKGSSTAVSALIVTMLVSGCSLEKQISYKTSIAPLVDKYCSECHSSPSGAGTAASGFRTDSYAGLMKGTKYGPVIVPNNTISSSFYRLVAGKVDPSIKMPHGKEALTAAEIGSIESWISQGAKDN